MSVVGRPWDTLFHFDDFNLIQSTAFDDTFSTNKYAVAEDVVYSRHLSPVSLLSATARLPLTHCYRFHRPRPLPPLLHHTKEPGHLRPHRRG